MSFNLNDNSDNHSGQNPPPNRDRHDNTSNINDLLRSLNNSISDLNDNISRMSQTNARNRDTTFRDRNNDNNNRSTSNSRSSNRSSDLPFSLDDLLNPKQGLKKLQNSIDKSVTEFGDEFKSTLLKSLIGDDLSKKVKDSIAAFTGDFGGSLDDAKRYIARDLAQKVANSQFGTNITDTISNLANPIIDSMRSAYQESRNNSIRENTGLNYSDTQLNTYYDIKSGRAEEKIKSDIADALAERQQFDSKIDTTNTNDFIKEAYETALDKQFYNLYGKERPKDKEPQSASNDSLSGINRVANDLYKAGGSDIVAKTTRAINTGLSNNTLFGKSFTAPKSSDKDGTDDVEKAVSELAKKALKSGDFGDIPSELVDQIFDQFGFGGHVSDFINKILNQGNSSTESSESENKQPNPEEIAKTIKENSATTPEVNLPENTEYNPEEIANQAKALFDKMDAGQVGGEIGVEDIGMDMLKDATLASSEFGAEASAVAGGMDALSAGLSTFAETILPGLMAVAPEILAVVAAVAVLKVSIDYISDAFQDTATKFKSLVSSLAASTQRKYTSAEKQTENAQKRLEADINTLVTTPFEILKNAAQELYNAWDNNIRTINATQGYSKEDLQNLMSSYSQRLAEEGYSSVVSVDDITDNLTKVLQAGLSGDVAEEFAYLATKLNAAIPTQDFFSYASDYATIAGNAILAGKSQSEAIEYANEQLETFASNILYASRELTGGFSTGLTNAESIFSDAIKITQSGKSSDTTQLSAVMTAVSAITGTIAPDLATSMVSLITKAATDGNSSSLVALRSLAGINSSNTEFLNALLNDPQTIFTTLFENLAEYQSMSNDAYMEVAEGLSEIFGVSKDAIARIDFNYLASAISNMEVSTESLTENLDLLKSGETTTSAEQMRMAQINEYMLDEGLTYVLDNEAGRAIQQHMWDEQIANELQETTYGVELTGSTERLITSIKNLLDKVYSVLNPIYGISSAVTQLATTAADALAMQDDIEDVLEAGKIANTAGSSEELYQLTTRGEEFANTSHELIGTLQELFGETGDYRYTHTGAMKLVEDAQDAVVTATTTLWTHGANIAVDRIAGLFSDNNTNNGYNTSVSSSYSWGMISKSDADKLKSAYSSMSNDTTATEYTRMSATAESQNISNQKTQSILDKALEALTVFTGYADTDFIDSSNNTLDTILGKTSYYSYMGDNYSSFKSLSDDDKYNAWKEYATSLGLSENTFEETLEKYGLSKDDIINQFDSYTTQAAVAEELQRQETEETFWNTSIEFYPYALNVMNDIFNNQFKWYNDWVEYYVNHTAYSTATGNAYTSSDVRNIQTAEYDNNNDMAMHLANALMSGTIDLRDPAVQTNVLLAKLIEIASAIMDQNNNINTDMNVISALSSDLAGLATGATVIHL